MAKVLVSESNLQNIAIAIRGKNGTQETYTPSEMSTAISNIPTGSGTIDDEAVLEYMTDKVENIIFPSSYANGDIIVNSSSVTIDVNVNTGANASANSQIYMSLENQTNKKYVLKYDDGESVKYNFIGANEMPNIQIYTNNMNINANNISAIDITNNAIDKYKITLPFDETKTSVAYVDVIHIDETTGLIQYYCDSDVLVQNGYDYGESYNLFKIGMDPSSFEYLTKVFPTSGEKILVSSYLSDLESVSENLGVYFDPNYTYHPYEKVNEFEILKYSEQTQDYTIPVSLNFELLDNISITSPNNEFVGYGVYINKDTKQSYVVMDNSNGSSYDGNISITYYDNGAQTAYQNAQEWINNDMYYYQLQESFTENININATNYEFVINISQNN